MKQRIALALVLLFAPAVRAQAQGKGFKDLVKHLEKNYRAKKTRIPMLGLANFAVKLVRPAGVKGFKLAIFENQDFSRISGAESLAILRHAYHSEWQPVVRVTSKKDGFNQIFIYSRSSGKELQFALMSLTEHQAVVLEARFNPEAAARFLENPKIMGIPLGKPERGPSNSSPAPVIAAAASRTPVRDSVAGESSPTPLALPAPAVNEKPAPIEIKPELPEKNAIRIETRLVNLNVKAMDRGGQPLVDLKPEDFTVFEDGVRQEVSHFRPVNAPVNLILLLDLSGSTKNKRKAMQEAAARFIAALPAADNVAIAAFTGKYNQLVDFTTDKAKLQSVLPQIRKISGDTAFYDSAWKALDRLAQVNDARKAIIVLTDGEDDSLDPEKATEHCFAQLLERAAEEDVTIYPIYFSPENHYDKVALLFGGGDLLGSDKSRIARKQLIDLADQTGGEIFDAQREEDLGDAYRRVAAELHTLYSLAYSPDQLKHNGEFRRISVKLGREGAVARTRRGYCDR